MSILKPNIIYAKTLPEAYWWCINVLFREHNNHVYTIDKGSFEGQRRLEFDYITVHVEYPGARPIVPSYPEGVPTVSSMEYVESYLPYLMTAKTNPNEQYTYGWYLEPQIKSIISKYVDYGPGNNQCYMTVGDKYNVNLGDPPCLRGIDTRILQGKLHFMVYFRSWDLWSGFPNNLGAIQLLKEYMASEIGVEDGELIAASKGLHIYEESWEIAKSYIKYA